MKDSLSNMIPLIIAIAAVSTWVTAPVAAQGCEGRANKTCCGTGWSASASDQQPTKPPATSPAARDVGDPYPLTTCPVSGEKLGAMGEPVIKVIDGREFRFCCLSCPPKFEKDPGKYLGRVDDQIIQDQLRLYPLDASVVSGKKLGDEAKPFDFVYRNRLIRLANEAEKAEFLAKASDYMAKLDKSVASLQGEHYPLKACVVDSMTLGNNPAEFVADGRLIRVCNQKDREAFTKDPARFLTTLDEAWKVKGGYPAASAPAGAGVKSSGKSAEPKATYTCPMHPDVVKDKPGQCPKCGMVLAKKQK